MKYLRVRGGNNTFFAVTKSKTQFSDCSVQNLDIHFQSFRKFGILIKKIYTEAIFYHIPNGDVLNLLHTQKVLLW